jgi:penicillin-binding protein 1C
LEAWLPVKWRRDYLIPQPDDGCLHMPALTGTDIKISGVKPGAILTTSSDRSTLPTIILETIGGIGRQYWYLNGAPVADAQSGQSVNYRLKQFGRYQLAVVDEAGNTDRVAFKVIR